MVGWMYLIRLCLLEGKKRCLRSVDVNKASRCVRFLFRDCSRIG